MKNRIVIWIGLLIICSSCISDDNVPNSQLTLEFSHNWDGTEITNTDFNEIKFTNANGEQLSIERLRYLISKVKLVDESNGITSFEGYNLIDVTNNKNLSLVLPQNIINGTYTLTFTFGFDKIDNQDGIYQDLNSFSWNVPGMLGGGYHYMQFDGKFLGRNLTPASFNYHVIRAVNRADPNNLIFEDTYFPVNLGTITISNNAIVEVKMNLAEWFKNPNTWDLNEFNTVLMPNFDAQLMMSSNGKNAFSLGEITQE